MAFPKSLKELCSPALLYFVISMISLLIALIQNLGNRNSYHIGSFSCRVPDTILIFVIKFIFILFFTYVLNLICKDGHVGLSWFLVLLPWITLLLMIGLIMLNQ
jgi:hypothetical protein